MNPPSATARRFNPTTGMSIDADAIEALEQLDYVNYVLKYYDRLMKAHMEIKRTQVCEELARMHGYDPGEVMNLTLTHRP